MKSGSGEILSFGESKKSSYSANGNVFSGRSPFTASATEENKKRRSLASRRSIDDEMLSFIAGVILPASNVKSGAGTVAVARGSNSEASVVNKADSGKAVQPPEKRPQKANDREESAVA